MEWAALALTDPLGPFGTSWEFCSATRGAGLGWALGSALGQAEGWAGLFGSALGQAEVSPCCLSFLLALEPPAAGFAQDPF